MKRQSGITVVEILVGLALSLIILAGVLHIFINNKQTYRVQEAFARLQENGRFAMQFITKDLRMAGFMGCAGKITNPIKNTANYYPPPPNPPDNLVDEVSIFSGSGVEGFEYDDLPIALTELANLTSAAVVEGTDIVRIKRASSTGAKVTSLAPADPLAASIKVDFSEAEGMFEANDYLFVSDCEDADIFVATTVSANPPETLITISHGVGTNTESKFQKPYGDDAEVFKLVNTTYYIGINSGGEHALYRQSLGNANTMIAEELVEGVEDMQLLYGEDTDADGTPNRYVDSATVNLNGDWNNIVSVRIELQIRSTEDNVTARTDEDEGDRRLRRKFITSIALRNQVI